MNTSLPDVAIVSGAGRGIGRASAMDIAALGIPVLCISRTENCQSTANEIIRNGGKAEALSIDLVDYKTTGKSVAAWLSNQPYQRIAFVGAAAILGPGGPVWESDLGGWDETFRANVLGNIAILQTILPRMRASGFGRVMMFAGGGSAYAYPTFPAYAITKTALVREVENIGEELKNLSDFSAVIMAPGAVDTDMLANVRAAGAEVRTLTAITEPVGFVTTFLTSPKARRLSGRFIHVRDTWRATLDDSKISLADNHWKLRRIE